MLCAPEIGKETSITTFQRGHTWVCYKKVPAEAGCLSCPANTWMELPDHTETSCTPQPTCGAGEGYEKGSTSTVRTTCISVTSLPLPPLSLLSNSTVRTTCISVSVCLSVRLYLCLIIFAVFLILTSYISLHTRTHTLPLSLSLTHTQSQSQCARI